MPTVAWMWSDGLLDAVDRAAWDLLEVAEAETAERAEEAPFLSLQARLDGGVELYAGCAGSGRNTGVSAIERDGRTYRSLQEGTPLRPDPGPAAGPDPPDAPRTIRRPTSSASRPF